MWATAVAMIDLLEDRSRDGVELSVFYPLGATP